MLPQSSDDAVVVIPLPGQPTQYAPGTPEKCAVMAARLERQEPTCHPADAVAGTRRPIYDPGNFKIIGTQDVDEHKTGAPERLTADERGRRVEEFFRRLTPEGRAAFVLQEGCWLLAPWRTGASPQGTRCLPLQAVSAWVFCQLGGHQWHDVDLDRPVPVTTSCGRANCFCPEHLRGDVKLRVLARPVKRFLELAKGIKAEQAAASKPRPVPKGGRIDVGRQDEDELYAKQTIHQLTYHLKNTAEES